jgi:hypothetical protein
MSNEMPSEELRAKLRYMDHTSTLISVLLDVLAAEAQLPKPVEDLYGKDARNIAHEFWLYGSVCFDTVKPIIYDPGDLVVEFGATPPPRSVKKVTVKSTGEDITSHACVLMHFREHAPFEFMVDPGRAMVDAYEVWSKASKGS